MSGEPAPETPPETPPAEPTPETEEEKQARLAAERAEIENAPRNEFGERTDAPVIPPCPPDADAQAQADYLVEHGFMVKAVKEGTEFLLPEAVTDSFDPQAEGEPANLQAILDNPHMVHPEAPAETPA